MWTLFTPSDVPDLHDLYGLEFKRRYEHYEVETAKGNIKLHKKIPALDLWRKMLGMLFETGHPWITFKDPCNLRSPQQHVGVVHSSNLCTEITLNTDEEEIAVCNLGSVNLLNHLGYDGTLHRDLLASTIKTAVRMLDNVIDINFYPVKKARTSNLKHRPVGLGLMGFQDCLYKMRIPYDSEEALAFADFSTELLCYLAYEASSDLAAERGLYESYQGSLWSQGIMPFNSMDLVAEARKPEHYVVNKSMLLDWEKLVAKIEAQGMRNSNCVAIAPTATISNIVGVNASIEPSYQNLYVKSNLSGEFTVINRYLVKELDELDLWDDVMLKDLKLNDGSVQNINRIPNRIKRVFATAFEVEPTVLVEAASRRQKWIDQAQSLNIYVKGVSGKKLDEIYKLAWVRGLKTTYYLRTLGATHAEKSTVETKTLNAVEVEAAACYLRPGDEGFEECEACQ
jgi:ribonucleoside-diphosphate reductase alpha chain